MHRHFDYKSPIDCPFDLVICVAAKIGNSVINPVLKWFALPHKSFNCSMTFFFLLVLSISHCQTVVSECFGWKSIQHLCSIRLRSSTQVDRSIDFGKKSLMNKEVNKLKGHRLDLSVSLVADANYAHKQWPTLPRNRNTN